MLVERQTSNMRTISLAAPRERNDNAPHAHRTKLPCLAAIYDRYPRRMGTADGNGSLEACSSDWVFRQEWSLFYGHGRDREQAQRTAVSDYTGAPAG